MRYRVFYFLIAFLQGICLPLIASLSFVYHSKNYGLTEGQYGQVFLIMVVASLITALFFRSLTKALGRGICFVLGWLCHVLFLAALVWSFFLTDNTPQLFKLLLGANFLFGFGFSLLLTVVSAELVDRFPDSREKTLTFLHGVLGLGAALSPALVGLFYSHWKWPYIVMIWCFVTLGVGLLLVLTGALPSLKEVAPPSDKGDKAKWPIGSLAFGLALIVYGTSEAIMANWSILYITIDKQIDYGFASMCLTLFWLAVTVGRLSVSFLIRLASIKFLYILSPCMMLVGFALALFSTSKTLILMSIICTGLGCSYFYPLTVTLSTRIYNAHRELLMSITLAGLMIGVGIGSSAIGFFRNLDTIDLRDAFIIALFMCIVLIAMSRSLIKNL